MAHISLVRKSYWKFIEDEARHIKSDGCTGVTDWHIQCCWEHDLACYYGKDPRLAYAWYCDVNKWDYWLKAGPITRRQADIAFGKCNWEWSPTRHGKYRSLIRLIGVRIGAFLGIGVRQAKGCSDVSKRP